MRSWKERSRVRFARDAREPRLERLELLEPRGQSAQQPVVDGGQTRREHRRDARGIQALREVRAAQLAHELEHDAVLVGRREAEDPLAKPLAVLRCRAEQLAVVAQRRDELGARERLAVVADEADVIAHAPVRQDPVPPRHPRAIASRPSCRCRP